MVDVSYDKNNFLCTNTQILLEAVNKLCPPDNEALREIHLFCSALIKRLLPIKALSSSNVIAVVQAKVFVNPISK